MRPTTIRLTSIISLVIPSFHDTINAIVKQTVIKLNVHHILCV